jgi:hypothetical protein
VENPAGLPRKSPAAPHYHVGAPASGKTTFLAALNIALQRMNGNWSITAADQHSEEALTWLTAELTTKHAFPTATVRPEEYLWILQGQVPVTIRRMLRKQQLPKQMQIPIELVDAPDETRGSSRQGLVEALLHSSGIVYTFDPVREYEVGDSYERVNGICNQLRSRWGNRRVHSRGLIYVPG